ncbi:MAG: DUF2339 domain-containing protein [Burkholderiales bacterium]|nr:DUF2339 domain-containing protein [Burkholderiales bacterium]
MWIIGLIIGAIVGGAMAGGEGAVLGAIAGAALVIALRRKAAVDPKLEERLQALEGRVARLAHTLDALMAQPRVPAAGTDSAVAEPAAPQSAAVPLTPAEQFAQDAMGAGTAQREPAEVASERVAASAETPQPPLYVSPPPAEDAFDRLVSRAWGWLTGGNTVVRVGVIVLFFGVAFLLKFAYDLGLMPPELRVAGVALGGIVLAGIGWRLRDKRETYALTLQGAGVGVLYLSIFAALRLYEMIPAPLAFTLLVVLSAASTALALLQNSQALAVLAVSGGFLAPILTSTGSGNHVALFSYYAVINAGILWLAAKKAWRPLNLTGFFFTFGVAAAWGAKYFRPELWSSTQPFLALFFLMYLAIPVLFAREAETKTEKYLDGTLVFGLPVVATGLQSQLVSSFEYGAAISAVVVSAIYLFAARFVRDRHGASLALLTQTFASLCIVFATLAIPLALDARWTSAAWALEGAAIAWVGIRQGRWLARIFGCLLQIAAAIAFLVGVQATSADLAVFNRTGMGFAFLAVAALFTALQFERHRESLKPWEGAIGHIALAIGLLWWYGGGLHEIETHATGEWEPQLALAFIVGSAIAFELIGARLQWRGAAVPALAVVPLGFFALAWQVTEYTHPFQRFGYLVWPAAFVTHLWVLRRRDDGEMRGFDWLHGIGLWLFAIVTAWEAAWAAQQAADPATDWGLAAWMAAPAALIAWLSTRGLSLSWPVVARLRGYLLIGALPVVAGLLFWLVVASFFGEGGAAPLPYVPILNPLDLGVVAVLFAGILWMRALSTLEFDAWIAPHPWLRYGIPGVAAFIAANGILIRALHQYAGVPMRFDAVMRSMLAQSALSLFWTVLALVLMVLANRLQRRLLWFVGAGLLGVTVLKLFIVDLSNVGGGERIVSFVGVGILMLVVGYFAPVPPRKEAAA